MHAQTSLSHPLQRTAGNENTAILKIIAIVSMLVDHAGAAFFPAIDELRLLGRIAFPLFAWGVVVGAEYSRNIWRYALRLLVVGIIAQPCYMWGLNHKWNEFNIFATLLLGLLAIAGIKEKKWGSHIWAPILSILIACAIHVDYGWKGVLLILSLYAARKNKGALACVMIVFCLFWSAGSYSISNFFGIRLPSRIPLMGNASDLITAIKRVQFWAILALPLMLVPMRFPVRLPKWIGYSAYPVHLLIYGLIRHWDQVVSFIQGFLN